MLKALFAMTKLFEKSQIDYCLIGGFAMLLYHGRASTVDLDFYVMVEDFKKVITVLEKAGLKIKKLGDYQLRTRCHETEIDLLLADAYIGHEVIQRALSKSLEGHSIRIATPEDIIILKSLANRSVDRRDIEELRELFGKKLDEAYIERKLKKLKKLIK